MTTVESIYGIFEIVKNDQNAFKLNDFEKKYIELFNKYEYIVGDYYQENLRLKGFNKEDAKYIPDYINEYCAIDSLYYILRNPAFDINYKVSEEEE